MHPELEQAMQHRVYPITRRIAIGQFLTPDRAYYLLKNGYTHVLNVSEAASVVSASPQGFQQVIDHKISDLVRIPDDKTIECFDVLHEMLRQRASRVCLPLQDATGIEAAY
jgi:hypothetical protein